MDAKTAGRGRGLVSVVVLGGELKVVIPPRSNGVALEATRQLFLNILVSSANSSVAILIAISLVSLPISMQIVKLAADSFNWHLSAFVKQPR